MVHAITARSSVPLGQVCRHGCRRPDDLIRERFQRAGTRLTSEIANAAASIAFSVTMRLPFEGVLFMVASEWFMPSPKSTRDPISRVAAAAIRLALEIGSQVDYPFSLNHSEATMDNTPGGSIGRPYASRYGCR